MGNYCTYDQIETRLFEPHASEKGQVEALISAASRMIDRMCEVSDNYFDVAGSAATPLTFFGSGTRYQRIYPRNSTIIAADVVFVDTTLTVPPFTVRGDYLVADKGYIWDHDEPLTVTAKWGFAAIPPDIVQATIELVIAQFRTSDGARERAVSDAGEEEFRIAKIPARVRETCMLWKKKRAVVFA